MSLAAVKFFREVNKPIGGRLIQASSIYGLVVCYSPRHMTRLTPESSPQALPDIILRGLFVCCDAF